MAGNLSPTFYLTVLLYNVNKFGNALEGIVGTYFLHIFSRMRVSKCYFGFCRIGSWLADRFKTKRVPV